MLLSVILTFLLTKCILADYATGLDTGGWQQSFASNGISNYNNNNQLSYGANTQDFSALGSLGTNSGWHDGGHISIDTGGWNQHHQHHHHHTHAIPIGEHIEVSKPIAIPVYKHIGIPLAQPIGIPVTHVTAIGVPQPYPVHVPVAHPVPIPVIKTIATIVEKKIPFPIEKIIPVPIEKLVPIHIEKQIPVPVEKPYPVEVPIYKHVFHRHKSHGWHR